MTDEQEERHHTDAEFNALMDTLRASERAGFEFRHERDELKAKLELLYKDNEEAISEKDSWAERAQIAESRIIDLNTEVERLKKKLNSHGRTDHLEKDGVRSDRKANESGNEGVMEGALGHDQGTGRDRRANALGRLGVRNIQGIENRPRQRQPGNQDAQGGTEKAPSCGGASSDAPLNPLISKSKRPDKEE